MGLDHRFGQATVTVTAASGVPLAATDVVAEQTRHACAFGHMGFDFIGPANGDDDGEGAAATSARLAELWLDLFNTATLPFYWAQFEPVRGRPDTERLRAAARWFADRGVAVKGHPLAWHTLAPEWLLPL